MADIVNTGATANDGSGDELRTAFQLINQRFQQLLGTLSQITWAPGLAISATPARQWTVVGGHAYVAAENHIAGATFAADLAAGKWLAVDVAQLIDDLDSSIAGRGADMVRHRSGQSVGDVLDALNDAIEAVNEEFAVRDASAAVRDASAAFRAICARMAAGEAIKIACYGDSTTDGNGTTSHTLNAVDGSGNALGAGDHIAGAPNAWPAKLRTLLRDMFDNSGIVVVNAGYSGKRLDNGWALANYDAAVTNNTAIGAPHICFIGFGLNDIAISGSQIVAHAAQTRLLALKLMAAGTVPVLLTCDPIWRVAPDVRDNKESSRQIDEVKFALASELNLPIIDMGMDLRQWLERNRDGHRWGALQADGLHFGDIGHAMKAGIVAASLFRDVFRFEGTRQQIMQLDSRAGYIGPYTSVTTSTNNDQGLNPFTIPTAGQVMSTLWVFNTQPDAELIYRQTNGDGYDDATFATPPIIRVTSHTSGAVRNLLPAGTGPQDVVWSLSDMPVRVGSLPYGLSSVEYVAGADTSASHWYGPFELWSPAPGSRARSDALAGVGELVRLVPDNGAGVELVPERYDGSNVFGLLAGEVADIMVDATLPLQTGVVLAHSAGWGSGTTYGTKGFLYVFRGSVANYIGVGRVDQSGVVTFENLGTLTVLNLTARAQFRVRISRNGDGKRLQIFSGWSLLASGQTVDVPSTDAAIHFAGAMGGLWWNRVAGGGVQEATLHRLLKLQGAA